MKCALCGEQFTDDDLEDLMEMEETFHREGNYFMCPDCYDDYRRMSLEDQLIALMESAS